MDVHRADELSRRSCSIVVENQKNGGSGSDDASNSDSDKADAESDGSVESTEELEETTAEETRV